MNFQKITENKKYSLFTFEIYLNDFEYSGFVPLSKKILAIYDKKNQMLRNYFFSDNNKFEKVLEIKNVKENDIKKSIMKKIPDLKKGILSSLLFLSMMTTISAANITDNQQKDKIDLTESGLYYNYEDIQFGDSKEKDKIIYTSTKNNEKAVEIINDCIADAYKIHEKNLNGKGYFEKSDKNTEFIIKLNKKDFNISHFKLIMNYLKLGELIDPISNDNQLMNFSTFMLPEQNKSLIYLNFNEEFFAMMMKSPENIEQGKKFITNVLVHEIVHAKYKGNEAEASFAQCFGEEIDLNNEFMVFLCKNFIQQDKEFWRNNIKTLINYTSIKNDTEFNTMKDLVNNGFHDYFKKLTDEDLTLTEKKSTMGFVQPDRVDLKNEFIINREYYQILESDNSHPLSISGGYVFNICKILKDNNYTSEKIYDFFQKLDSNGKISSFIELQQNFKIKESMGNVTAKDILNTMILNSLTFLDKSEEFHSFKTKIINENSNILSKNETEGTKRFGLEKMYSHSKMKGLSTRLSTYIPKEKNYFLSLSFE